MDLMRVRNLHITASVGFYKPTIVLLYIVLWKIYKNFCVRCKQILFVVLKIQEQTHQAAASLETIQVLALFSQRCISHAHCARYNLQIYNNYSTSPRWIWSDKITNERVARVGYNHFISNKREWNNCFGKFSNWVLPPIFISTILQSENF